MNLGVRPTKVKPIILIWTPLNLPLSNAELHSIQLYNLPRHSSLMRRRELDGNHDLVT